MSQARVRYSSIAYPDFDIHVRSLWDRQQFSDDDGEAQALGISSAEWPLFGNLWGSGRVLARIMAERDIEGLTILEVGCGIGLSSLVLNHRGADITATDHHPEVESFLHANTELNGDPDIPFVREAWNEDESELKRFDLIVGADLLYEHHQLADLAAFLKRHCRDGGQVVIVDPGRKLRAKFGKAMVAQGFSVSERRSVPDETGDEAKAVHVLTFELG